MKILLSSFLILLLSLFIFSCSSSAKPVESERKWSKLNPLTYIFKECKK